jgi:hypothetical protein
MSYHNKQIKQIKQIKNHGDNNQNQNQNQNHKYPNQEEMCEHLISKIRNFKNVIVITNKIENQQGVLYRINIKNRSLSNYLEGVFHSLLMQTVSHGSRIIYIKLVFNDNEERNADMNINRDAIYQIFREITNTTKDNGDENRMLESVRIEEFTDKSNHTHLAVIAETVKGASLIYSYLKTMEFVRAINEKYAGTSELDDNTDNGFENMTSDEIQTKKQILEKELQVLQELENAKKASIIDELSSIASATPTATPLATAIATPLATTTATTTTATATTAILPAKNKAKYNNTKTPKFKIVVKSNTIPTINEPDATLSTENQ